MYRPSRIAVASALLLLCGLAGCVVEAPRRPVVVERPVVVAPAPAVVVRP